MPQVNIYENDFYVTLFSNNSMNFYPNNTLSSFTNCLYKTLKLNENWSVGLTDITFNKLSTKPAKIILKHTGESSDEDDTKHDSLLDIDDYEFIPKRRKRAAEKEIVIWMNNDKTDKMIVTQTDLKKIAYKGGHVNFGKFLEELGNRFHSSVDITPYYKTLCQDIFKISIQDYFMNLGVFAVKLTTTAAKKITAAKDEYVLHMYIGPKNNDIVLKYKEYNNVAEFLDDVIIQIPKDLRNVGKLINIFDAKLKWTALKKYTEDFTIQFPEYNAIFKVNSPTITKKEISLEEMIQIFHNNLFFNETYTPEEEYDLRKNIQIAILDVLRNNELRFPHQLKTAKPKDIKLKMPVKKLPSDKFETKIVTVEIKDYIHMRHFLEAILEQIPIDKRDGAFFMETLEDIFKKTLPPKTTTPPPSPSTLITTTTSIVTTTTSSTTTITSPSPIVGTILSVPTIKRPDVVFIPPSVVPSAGGILPKTSALSYHGSDPGYLYVYTDIIKPRIVGNKQARILRILPIVDTTQQLFTFDNIEYVPVEKEFIENISIQIADSTGEKADIVDSKSPTFVTLHFRKKL